METWLNYFETMQAVVEKVKTTQRENILKAAQILADTTEKGGIIYGFGTGHSHLVVDDAVRPHHDIAADDGACRNHRVCADAGVVAQHHIAPEAGIALNVDVFSAFLQQIPRTERAQFPRCRAAVFVRYRQSLAQHMVERIGRQLHRVHSIPPYSAGQAKRPSPHRVRGRAIKIARGSTLLEESAGILHSLKALYRAQSVAVGGWCPKSPLHPPLAAKAAVSENASGARLVPRHPG